MKTAYFKKLNVKAAICFTIVFVAAIIGCHKEIEKFGQTGPESVLATRGINIAMLQKAYNKGINVNSKLKTADVSQQTLANIISSLTVDWTSYTLFSYPDSTQVIEFTMPDDTSLLVPGQLAVHDSVKYQSKTAAVFIINQDTVTTSFFMKTIEDETAPGYQPVLNQLHYKQIPNTFTGNILYFSLSRQYLNGYSWSAGNITKAISLGAGTPQPPQTPANNSVKKIKTDALQLTNCVEDDYEVYGLTISGGQITYADYIGTIVITTCDIVDDGNAGGTNTTISGGATGDNTTPNQNPCTPAASSPAVESVKGKLVIDVTTGGSGGSSGGSSSPCNTTPPSTPIFGVKNSNAQIPDTNFDNFLSYAQSLGLTVSDPFNVTLTVNGTNYTGQITEIYNQSGQVIAAYFSPDTTSGPFQVGMEYSIGSEQDNTSTQASGDVFYGGLDLGNPSANIGNSTISYIHNTSGGSTVPTTITANDIADANYVSDGKSGINPQLYINCFSDGKTASGYKMTIYVAQPAPGTNSQWSSIVLVPPMLGQVFTLPGGQFLNVGHTFICFEKDNTDGTSVKQVMGFYPSGIGTKSKGIIKDDSGHPYNESYSISVSLSQMNAALAKVLNDNTNSQYVLSKVIGSEYNCTDAALNWFDTAGGVFSPVSRGFFINSPGDFGYALAGVRGATTANGNAPQSHGPCN